jgi:Chromo (CHRromatin Organisation MOdifier) domain
VKWKGFPHEGNTWEKRKDISPELVKEFEATYQGNYSGVRLLKKRVLRGKVEYLVEWKGRPESENSWEKEATVSRERIMEYKAS